MAEHAERMALHASGVMKQRPTSPAPYWSPRTARRPLGYTQRMNDAIEKIKARKAMRAEYARLQFRLDKNRRIIYLGSCLLCLFAGFMAGMIITAPKETRVVAIELPAPAEPEAQTTSL
jgi:hypothetical protein